MTSPAPYMSLTEIHREVLPTLPNDWQIGADHINDAPEAAAYWLLAHGGLAQRVAPYVQRGIQVSELLDLTSRMSSSEKVLVLYAIDFAAPGYVQNMGVDIPGPATVARLLNYSQGEVLEAAMALANGRRHPAVAVEGAASPRKALVLLTP